MARKRSWVACGALAIALVTWGCGNAQKEATEGAINAAQTAINTVKEEAEKYVPDQLQAAQNALQSARDALAKGDYQAALNAARDATNKAKELATSSAARKEEWKRSWGKLNESLPKSMDAVKRKLDAYARGAHMPEGWDQDKLAEAKTQYDHLKQEWESAKAEAQQDLGDALRKASGVKDELEKLEEMLGIKS